MTQTLTIERLGHLGDGVARGPVYVPGALPGEEVRGAVADGAMPDAKIVTPAPERVRPPCPNARRCGGCALQHAAEGFIARWKADVVRAALAAQGLAAPFRPIQVSPPQTRRRATLAARRTKGGALVGFHARGSDAIVPIAGCLLLHPYLMAALPAVEGIALCLASRKSTLSVTLTLTDTGLDVDIGGAPRPDARRIADLAAIAHRAGFARLCLDGETIAQAAPPMLRLGPARVAPPPGAFLQATVEGESALQTAVMDALFQTDDAADARRKTAQPASIIDLFAGCGTFALPLSAHAAVHAVEGEATMVEALAAAWRQTPGLRPLTGETRDLFRRPLAADELRADAVVIDPPRAGAEDQCRALALSGVARIAFVSCNPVTFARDARILTAGGYVLRWVQVVDQFRWSHHVELVARFDRDPSTTFNQE